MKKWIGILLMIIPLWGQAQIAAPDDAAIEVAIRDVGSLYYYPALMQRYQRGDSLLGRQEYRHLYYGYQFDPNYTPRETISQLDSVLMIVRHVPNISLDQCRQLIRYGAEVMEKDPFNPQVLNTMTYAYGRLGDVENERRSARRFDGVMMAIISSGEGSEEKSPWHILYFSHAQDV
ncbi:MAG: DUF4919 domain-containing protein, partial [Rikenellaceae bacterium]|nr:DUF4919 domain-containing protein [Rikenellaceae bacterium]